MIFWCIWKRRNDKLWNDVETQPCISVHLARDVLSQWQQVHARHERREQGEHQNNGMTNQRREGWIRPLAGEVKCNVDATILRIKVVMGSLCEDRGEFMGAKPAWHRGLPQPQEAEARGLKEAIKWLGTVYFGIYRT
jgi:hypothetical protein